MKKQRLQVDAFASQTAVVHFISPTTYLIYISGLCHQIC